MMQAAEDGPRFDAAEGVNRSPRRRILVQGQVFDLRSREWSSDLDNTTERAWRADARIPHS